MGGRGNFKVATDHSWDSFGGYMNAKVQKLNEQFSEVSKNTTQLTSIFNKVAIHVNGYTNPTSDELKVLMAQHGGKYHSYYSSSSTTHVIASNLPHAKLKELHINQNVVKPEWITDSIKEGKLLPVHSYLLAVHKTNKDQGSLNKFVKQKSSSGSHMEIGTSSSAETSNPVNQAGFDLQGPKSNKSVLPTANSSFLSEFYSHSRLHFLSTWKMELTEYVRSLTSAESNKLTGQKRLLQIANAKVGLLSRPHLRGKAVAVTHHLSNTPSLHVKRPDTDANFEMNYFRRKTNKNNNAAADNRAIDGSSESSDLVPSYSEIASCNYKAREAGLKNGMFYGKAKELCPDLIAIPYDFDAYRDTSQKLYDILSSYTLQIEAVSCDEALLDITGVVAKTEFTPSFIVEEMRKHIKEETGCDASAGIGPNIVLARMATREGKPNGQHQIKPNEIRAFLQNRPVKSLPGVGYATARRLEEMGITTCGEIVEVASEVLKKEFGVKTGEKLLNFAMGIDDRKICSSKERKSVSADVNYGIRLSTEEELQTFLFNLSQEVSSRLKKVNLAGKKLTLKVMVRRPDAPVNTIKFGGHGVCQSLSRSKAIPSYTNEPELIAAEVSRLMKSLRVNIADLRGIGIQVTQLNNTSKVGQSKSITDFVKSTIDTPSTSKTEIPESSKAMKNDEKTPESPQCEISASFLEALPEDLRDEVTKDWKAHRRRMEMTPLISASPTKQNLAKRSSPSKRKPSKSVRFKKSPAKRKRTLLNPTATNTSPNKLITDMFPFVSKAANNPSKNHDLPQETVRRNIIKDVQNDRVPEEASPSPEEFNDFPSPMLGGATTISGSRDAVRNWVKTFLISLPEKEDIEEVSRYLQSLVSNDHDIEGACLILHTLRRSIFKIIENSDVNDTQIDRDIHVKSWTDLYNRMASALVELVKILYGGALLDIKFMP